jgi:hypothetical protein
MRRQINQNQLGTDIEIETAIRTTFFLGMSIHAYNPSTREGEVGGSQDPG